MGDGQTNSELLRKCDGCRASNIVSTHSSKLFKIDIPLWDVVPLRSQHSHHGMRLRGARWQYYCNTNTISLSFYRFEENSWLQITITSDLDLWGGTVVWSARTMGCRLLISATALQFPPLCKYQSFAMWSKETCLHGPIPIRRWVPIKQTRQIFKWFTQEAMRKR